MKHCVRWRNQGYNLGGFLNILITAFCFYNVPSKQLYPIFAYLAFFKAQLQQTSNILMFTLFVFGFLSMNEVNVLNEVFDMLITAMNIAHNYKNDKKRGQQQPLK